MTCIGSGGEGCVGICHRGGGVGGRGRVGATIGIGFGNPFTELQQLLEVTAAHVHLPWISEDRAFLFHESVVEHQKVWAEGRRI